MAQTLSKSDLEKAKLVAETRNLLEGVMKRNEIEPCEVRETEAKLLDSVIHALKDGYQGLAKKNPK